jgi:hypothetical protein
MDFCVLLKNTEELGGVIIGLGLNNEFTASKNSSIRVGGFSGVSIIPSTSFHSMRLKPQVGQY